VQEVEEAGWTRILNWEVLGAGTACGPGGHFKLNCH
jgi:hypothetical protein